MTTFTWQHWQVWRFRTRLQPRRLDVPAPLRRWQDNRHDNAQWTVTRFNLLTEADAVSDYRMVFNDLSGIRWRVPRT